MTPSAAPSTPIGLVVRRSARELGSEPFYIDLIAGMEQALAPRGIPVLMRVIGTLDEELACYRRWSAAHSVAAVVLVDLQPDDPRPAVMRSLGLPAVIVGEPTGGSLPAIRTDGGTPMRAAVTRLVELGHQRLARVTGLSRLVHTRDRTAAFSAAAAELDVDAVIIEGDYTAESGARATRQLLARPDAPTAIIYDNDVMAVAGLETALELGVDVPGELSLLAWDDSVLCRLARTPLSAMAHDVHAVGMLVADALVAVLDGIVPADVYTPSPVFVGRATTAAAPGEATTAVSSVG